MVYIMIDGFISGKSSSAGITEASRVTTRGSPNSLELDDEITRLIALGAYVELCPVAAVTRGIATQEAIKVHLVLSFKVKFLSVFWLCFCLCCSVVCLGINNVFGMTWYDDCPHLECELFWRVQFFCAQMGLWNQALTL
jgi:hypothetical protein